MNLPVALRVSAAMGLAISCVATVSARTTPPPPKPEPITVRSLPLPPTAPSDAPGSCTTAVNPRGTGCMSGEVNGIIEGPAYTWDSQHVLLAVQFVGAAQNSTYDGPQVIAIKTDGKVFPNGDPWKCITCGIPAEVRKDANPAITDGGGRKAGPGDNWMRVDHPQAFPGDRKMIAGNNVVDCGSLKLTDASCTPDKLKVYPIRWDASKDGSGPTGSMRELRLNPDGQHLMWSHMNSTPGNLSQHGLVGRLVFNPAPKSGQPLAPRFDLADVFVLTNSDDSTFGQFMVDPKDPSRLINNLPKAQIGEARGWTRDGKSVVGMGFEESGGVDMYITDLKTGASRRLTSTPGYADPILMSPDDKWFVVFDNRGVDRHMYYGGLQGIPPLIDTMTMMVKLSAQFGYRNGMRRFFQPYLIDAAGDRGDYQGQQLNAGPGTPGSPSDPNWNARADPAWASDGTAVVYWQAQVTSPDCGGANPLPCPASTEPGGRRSRLMIAKLTSRKPLPLGRAAKPGPISVAWGTPYKAGDPMPRRAGGIPPGKYTMAGRLGGSAQVEVGGNGTRSIKASYADYTDDGLHVINGTESAEMVTGGGKPRIVWHSDLRASGKQNGTKKSSAGGFVVSPMGEPLEGELVTTIDGKAYRPPQKGT